MSEKRILKMVPPNDPRLLSKIAPYQDDMLKENDFKDRQALCSAMYDTMKKYGGLGLSCNQVGLPYRMFVMGGHPEIDLGRTRYVFNPEVLETGYKMSDSGTYSIPAAETREQFLEVIEQLPLVAPPEIFGADSA